MNRAHSQPDVAGAIRRSSRARARLRWRRRGVALMTALLAVGLAGAGTWSIDKMTGNDVLEAAVTKAQSLADMLGQRSPGTRLEGQLTKTKHARLLSKRVTPARSPKATMTDLAQLLDAAPPLALPVDFAAPPQAAMTTPSFGDFFVPPPAAGPPGTLPPANVTPANVTPANVTPGGVTPAAFPTSEPKALVLVPSAVPEPGAWAMMLTGFALIGWKMRRRPLLSLKLG